MRCVRVVYVGVSVACVPRSALPACLSAVSGVIAAARRRWRAPRLLHDDDDNDDDVHSSSSNASRAVGVGDANYMYIEW